MASNDRDPATPLDHYLDAFVQGEPTEPDDLDPSLIAAVQNVHALDTTPTPSPASARVWHRITASPHQPSTPDPSHREPARRLPRPARLVPTQRRWSLAELSTAAVLLLTLAVAYLAFGPANAIAPGDSPSSVELYVSTGWSQSPTTPQFDQIDPATLTDVENGTSIAIGSNAQDWSDLQATIRTMSADGSPLVFRADANLLLSADGTRLVVRHFPGGSRPVAWSVLDTSDGRLVVEITASEPDGWVAWIDPAGHRLYRLLLLGSDPYSSSDTDASGPRPVRLVAHDLATGKEAGRVDLPDVAVGDWNQVTHGLAVSPDGRQVAIVHADREAVTLVDAEHLAVERTISLTRPQSPLDRLVALLPLVPQDAAAKSVHGSSMTAAYAPDGRHLYISGVERTDGTAPGEYTERGLGLKVVDLEDGTIVAEALPGAQIQSMLPTPDGQAVYVFGPKATEVSVTLTEFGRIPNWTQDGMTVPGTPDGEPPSYVLRLLDAATLTLQAEREFDEFRWVLLRPA